MKNLTAINRRIRAALLRRGVRDEDVEDFIQEAHAKLHLYEKDHRVEHSEAFLVRVSLNLATDAGRRKRRSPIGAEDIGVLAVADPSPGPAEVVDARQRLRRMTEGLNAMTPKNRAMLLAHRVEGLKYQEIARRHGVTVSAVERQIARAVHFLTEWMEGW